MRNAAWNEAKWRGRRSPSPVWPHMQLGWETMCRINIHTCAFSGQKMTTEIFHRGCSDICLELGKIKWVQVRQMGLNICGDTEDQLLRFQSMLWPFKVIPSLSSFIRVLERLSGLFLQSFGVFQNETLWDYSRVLQSLSGTFRGRGPERGIIEGHYCLQRSAGAWFELDRFWLNKFEN